MPPPTQLRVDGYAAIGDYAVVGDGRTVALIARDGAVDWLCLPDVHSPSVFGRLLDAGRGGAFTLQPTEPFESTRRYEDGSNVLETTFRTASGSVCVRDAMLLTDLRELAPLRELARRVEGLDGTVELEWRVEPRFAYGRDAARWENRGQDRRVAQARGLAVSVHSWDAGALEVDGGAVHGRFAVRAGDSAMLDLTVARYEPLVVAGRDDTERRFARTRRFWADWIRDMQYDGRWFEHVRRSVLVLKLLIYAPSGASVAAPTTSLPEAIGGSRNWDYRFTWIRDATFTIDALMRLGFEDEGHAFLWWAMHATRITQPELHVLYDVNGGRHVGERALAHLRGYRNSQPVRVGNGAVEQLQLDIYGGFVNSIWLYCHHGHAHRLDRDTAKEIAEIADHVAKIWDREDSGIWEVRRNPTHFIQSKAMCAIALERAVDLAEAGVIPSKHIERWREGARAARAFVDERGWSSTLQSYVQATDTPNDLDASLLTLPIFGWDRLDGDRARKTVDAVRRHLADGPLVYRYRGDDGVTDGGDEGFFLTCSFWLVDALARTGRVDEAADLMNELIARSNDVGLYAEEIARDGTMLGNFPQALTHLALINAAASIRDASS